MKKFFYIFACLALVLVVAGCGKETNTNLDINENFNKNSQADSFDNFNISQDPEPANINSDSAGVGEVESLGEESASAQKRDEQRLEDIKRIRAALEKYKNENGNYPDDYPQLTPRYLSAWPTNPTPGGAEYVYTPIGSLPASYYDLSYVLESGAEGVEAGDHIAGPDGIAVP